MQVGCEVRFDLREYMAAGKRGFCRISFSRMLHTGHVQGSVQDVRARRAYLSDTIRADVAQLKQKGHTTARVMVMAQENLKQRFSVLAASNNELRVCLLTIIQMQVFSDSNVAHPESSLAPGYLPPLGCCSGYLREGTAKLL